MSNTNKHHPNEQEFLDNIQRRAAVDGDFRQRLLNEPDSVLAELAEQEIPADFTIRFIEKDESTDALIVLPDMVAETTELSEAQLEAVAGGQGDDTCWWTCGVTEVDVEMCEA